MPLLSKTIVVFTAMMMATSLLTSPTGAEERQSLSREEVGQAVADVLEALAGRKLTPQEIAAVAEEYIFLFGDTECTAKCIEAVNYNAQRIAPVRAKRGGPQEALVRHDYISNIYFSPQQHGSLIQRISAEADPIMVVEPSPQRLMTRADVVAAMNLYRFAQESGPPETRSFPEEEIVTAADMLNQLYVSERYVMPRHLPLAATYWSGLEQGWQHFTEQERALVRAYFNDDKKYDPLPAGLYAVLLGLAPNDAQQFHMDEFLQGFKQSGLDIALEGAITQHKIQSYSYIWTSGPYR